MYKILYIVLHRLLYEYVYREQSIENIVYRAYIYRENIIQKMFYLEKQDIVYRKIYYYIWCLVEYSVLKRGKGILYVDFM